MTRRQFHEDECAKALYGDQGICTCDETNIPRNQYGDEPVYGEEPSSYDGRTHGPALDW